MEKKYFQLVSLNISKNTGTVKTPVESITLVEDKGVLNDAHFDKLKDRQVSILAIEDIEYTNEKMKTNLKPGDFAENITTRGVIFAAINGYLDDIEVKDVRKFEADYLAYLKSSGLGILEEIVEKKAISDDLTAKMKSALATFKKQFTA